MSRYAGSIAEAARRATRMSTGAGVILVSPGEQEAVSEALCAEVPFQRASLSEVGMLEHAPFRKIVLGIGPKGPERKAQLEQLNARRGWFSTHDQRVILVVDSYELQEIQAHAADLFSARPFFVKVPFVPDPNVDVGEARAQLAASLLERYGKLDMRGLIRRESQDVAFSIEELRQELWARSLAPDTIDALDSRPLADWVKDAAESESRALVVLGGPGSGKTFTLRWLAIQGAREGTLFDIQGPLPLLVSIAAFARTPDPVDLREHIVDELLRNGQQAAHVVERALVGGRALVFLDGLDEVQKADHRERVLGAIRELRAAAPRCLFIMTSRPAGYLGLSEIPSLEVLIDPFDDAQIEAFLTAWSVLYARERLGPTAAAAETGRREANDLLGEIQSNPGVQSLARTPLLLTVIAVVHRIGVRLPDHRVELYDQITQVLVEKWNRVRGLSSDHSVASPPLKAVDAVRLLGPLALRMVDSGIQSNIPEEALRADLATALDSGALRGLASVDETLELFRDTLGLLVEVAPGLFTFLHLTLAEYFAAWELVRSDGLEKLLAEPTRLFAGRYQEVVLLAIGVLGLLRADDERLTKSIDDIARAAGGWSGDPDIAVPSLLVGLLCDDANLRKKDSKRLANALIPDWFVPFSDRDAPRRWRRYLTEHRSEDGSEEYRLRDIKLDLMMLDVHLAHIRRKSSPWPGGRAGRDRVIARGRGVVPVERWSAPPE